MGLDQYAFARRGEEQLNIAYWRKHANLEGWMAELYEKRGGKDIFNCVELRLFEDDIAALEEQYQNLTDVKGFFWGDSRPEDDEKTKEFIEGAKCFIEDGWEIIYTSWW